MEIAWFRSTAQVAWTREGLLEYVVQHIVVCDLVSVHTILDRATAESACLVSFFLSFSHSVSLTGQVFAPFSNFNGQVQKRQISHIARLSLRRHSPPLSPWNGGSRNGIRCLAFIRLGRMDIVFLHIAALQLSVGCARKDINRL